MSTEAPEVIYPGDSFFEPFNNEALFRRNSGEPTAITFNNGIGTFNGTTSKANIDKLFQVFFKKKTIGSITIGFMTENTGNHILLSAGDTNAIQTIGIVVNNGKVSFSVWDGFHKLYVSSSSNSITSYKKHEVVVTQNGTTAKLYLDGVEDSNWTFSTDTTLWFNDLSGLDNMRIGCCNYDSHGDNSFHDGTIDYIRYNERPLTAAEIYNRYHNLWNVELSLPNTLLDYNSSEGVIECPYNTLTPDSTLKVVKIGSKYSALWDGANSKIDTGSDFIGTKAITVMGWVKPYSFGEIAGHIFSNFSFSDGTQDGIAVLIVGGASKYLRFYSNKSNFAFSAANSIYLNKKQFFTATRTITGICNIYIGDFNTAPSLNGSANQASGTPIVGSKSIVIGNNDAQTRTFDGLIPKIKVVEGILTLAQITQYWSETLKDLK